jgi:hypothetical protein
MDAPADRSTPSVVPPVHTALREAARLPRHRRPTGEPPPLPYQLQTSGVGWTVAAVVLYALTLAVFARGLRGPAVAVTVADDAVVRWLAGLPLPWLELLVRVASWWSLLVLYFGLLLALLVLRRWRHLIVWLIVWNVADMLSFVVTRVAQRPRPFGVELRAGWGGWAMPSLQAGALAAILVAILYTMVPEGRWRNTGKWVVTRSFAVLLPDCGLEDAKVIADRLLPAQPEGTCSIGLAAWDGAESKLGLVARADKALYAAKEGGRNRWCASPPPGQAEPVAVREHSVPR